MSNRFVFIPLKKVMHMHILPRNNQHRYNEHWRLMRSESTYVGQMFYICSNIFLLCDSTHTHVMTCTECQLNIFDGVRNLSLGIALKMYFLTYITVKYLFNKREYRPQIRWITCRDDFFFGKICFVLGVYKSSVLLEMSFTI